MRERIKIIIPKGLILLILGITVLVKIDVLYSQENWVWSEPIQIHYHGDTPDIDVDRKNSHAHIISMKTYGEGILYSEVDSLGNVLIKGFQVPTDFGDKGGIYYGATVAVDQQGYPHIIYRRHLANYWYYHLYYIYKTSSGWSKDKLIATNVRRGYIVRMDIDGNNRVHLIYSSVNDSLWGKVTYYQIQDGEVVNQLSQTLTDPQSQEDIIFIVENRFDIESSYEGNVHVVLGCPFRRNGSITYFYSNDSGENFTEWGPIQSEDCTRRLGDPDLCLDKVGNIHICYGSNNDKALNYEPSIRYVRMSKDDAQENYIIQEHNIINHPGSIEQSSDDSHWGVGSIAVSDEGKYVIGTYLSKPGGILWARISEDGGTTWGTPKKLSETCGGDLGRNLHLIRANRNHFYLVYPENNPQEVRLRIIHLGDYYPFASAGGPYSAKEGDVVELNMSASVDSGWYAGISEYAWDWNQDGVYDFKTTLPKVNHLFTDNFTGNAVLRVTDNSGKIDYDTTYCNIINVPPTVDAGDDIVCEEGDTLYFSAVVEDPGDDEITYLWDFNNGDYSYIPDPTYIYTDDSTYQVSVKVSDGDGGIDKDEIVIHVNNSDPIVEAGGPYQGVIKSNIFLTAQVYDKGASDEIIYKRWDLNNDQVFETQGYEAVVNFKEAGTYTVWFKAGDDDGGVGLDSAVVLVSCEVPYIVSIPDQSIQEGGTFPPIELDMYVYDQDHSRDQLEWSFKGNKSLDVSLNERVLQVSVPDSNWWGEEEIQLQVKDPVDNRDSCKVLFTVNPVNDPPRWIGLNKFSFREDDSLIIAFQEFHDQVEDIDDDFDSLRFAIGNNTTIEWFADNDKKILCLFAPPNWYGSEELDFIVTDTSGAQDQIRSKVSVYDDKKDCPQPFSLIQPLSYFFKTWPDTITFIWHSSSDPDSGSHVFYKWELRAQENFSIIKQKLFLHEDDTVYCYKTDTTLPADTYLWSVTAYDELNYSFKVIYPGTITLEGPIDTTSTPDTTDTTSTPDTTGINDIRGRNIIIPDNYALLKNYPNPFNPNTKIRYALPIAGRVSIKIYNMMGQNIRTLVDGYKTAGYHQVIWDGCNDEARKMPSGMYIYVMRSGFQVLMQKALLMK